MTGIRIVAAAAVFLMCVACFPEAPLPTATATLHGAGVELPRASYCWNSGMHAECAESAGPDQLLATGYMKPYRTAGGFDATVAFHGPTDPKSFEVVLVLSPAGSSATSVRAGANHSFSIPAVTPGAAGVYVYVVTATWSQGDVGFFLALDLVPGLA